MVASSGDYYTNVPIDPMRGIRPSRMNENENENETYGHYANHRDSKKEEKDDAGAASTDKVENHKAAALPLQSKVWYISSTGRFDWFIPAIVQSYNAKGREVTGYVLRVDDDNKQHENAVYDQSDIRSEWMRKDKADAEKDMKNASPADVVRRWDEVEPTCPEKGIDSDNNANRNDPTLDRLAQAKKKYGNDLGFEGVKQTFNGREYGPEMWGITLQQLKDVIDDPDFDKSINAKYIGERVSGGMTMRQVVHKIFKKKTKGQGIGYSLLINKGKPLRAKIMVSHSWDEDYEHFISALKDTGEEGPFWICATAIYQCEDMPAITIEKQLGPRAENGPFATVLKQADKMVSVMTPESDIYTRLWCVYEMYVAVHLGVLVVMAYYSESKGWGGSGQIYSNAAMDTANIPVQAFEAKCWEKKDMDDIHADVEKLDGGFDLLDAVIYWVKVTSLIQNLDVGKMENIIATPFGVSSASCAGARVNVAIAKVLETWEKSSSGRFLLSK